MVNPRIVWIAICLSRHGKKGSQYACEATHSMSNTAVSDGVLYVSVTKTKDGPKLSDDGSPMVSAGKVILQITTPRNTFFRALDAKEGNCECAEIETALTGTRSQGKLVIRRQYLRPSINWSPMLSYA